MENSVEVWAVLAEDAGMALARFRDHLISRNARLLDAKRAIYGLEGKVDEFFNGEVVEIVGVDKWQRQ